MSNSAEHLVGPHASAASGASMYVLRRCTLPRIYLLSLARNVTVVAQFADHASGRAGRPNASISTVRGPAASKSWRSRSLASKNASKNLKLLDAVQLPSRLATRLCRRLHLHVSTAWPLQHCPR